MVHIIETIEGLPFEDLRPFYRRMERKARTAMKLLTKRAPEGAVNVTHAVACGRRAEEIVRFAAANDVDLIVLRRSYREIPRQIGCASVGLIR